MIASEAAWVGPDIFGNVNTKPAHVQHVADYHEHQRLERIQELSRRGAMAHVRSTVGM